MSLVALLYVESFQTGDLMNLYLLHWQMASTAEPPGKPLVSSFNRRPHLLTHINDESGGSSYLQA